MSRNKLSAVNRGAVIDRMTATGYDLIVIGGGITGAGIALDAAARGLKVALFDKQDFSAGTSSRSTKLIHGGLRYLKQLELKLVRDVGRERTVIHKNAPHLVIPVNMLVPVVKKGTYSTCALRLGLWIYDLLAGVMKEEKHTILSAKQALEQEPLLDRALIKGAGLYTEYRTDDARLTIETIKTAVEHGADCINYTEVKDFIYEQGKIKGVSLLDRTSNISFDVHARQVVNAGGPWVDELRKKEGKLSGKVLHHTKGVHITVPFDRFPVRQAVYFDAFDTRLVFAIPRGNCTYIGTTDTEYKGDLANPRVTVADADYLLNAVNHVFTSVKLDKNDILSCWAGIRPLVHEEGKPPSEISRKDEIFTSASGLISIAGGKLTGYRKMAEKAVDLVMHNIKGTSFIPSRTRDIVLCGGRYHSAKEVNTHIDELVARAGAIDKALIARLEGMRTSSLIIQRATRMIRSLPC
jgi:glycerol-3-phosphate dehydrogenase